MMNIMRMKSAICVGLAVLLLAGANAFALDPPHNELSVPPIECDSCHIGHGAPGAALTSTTGNANLCFIVCTANVYSNHGSENSENYDNDYKFN